MKIGKTGVKIEFLGNSGFLIKCKEGKRIVIDPYEVSEVGCKEKADIIMITHSHSDSCSIRDIEKFVDSEKGAIVMCPADCQSKIMKLQGIKMEVVEVGDKVDMVGGNIKIEAVSAYNKHKDYHPKSEGWQGYLIKMGNVVVYHSGDSDFIPEMNRLSGHGKKDNEFVALLPVCGKEVMDAEQAADAASVINPSLAIPMKYSDKNKKDAKLFADLCKEKNVRVEILEKI